MGIIIDAAEERQINIAPATEEEEIIQNLWFLYSSIEYDVPLDRGLGMGTSCIDRPLETAKALAITDVYDKTGEYEPRAEIVNIDFSVDYGRGILRPAVEVEINV